MSNDKGIFEPQEGFASPPKSPFSVDDSSDNPFASPNETKSPFAPADDAPPQRRNPESTSPFATSDESRSPFSPGASQSAAPSPSQSPFGTATEDPGSSPAESPFGAPAREETPAEAAPASAGTLPESAVPQPAPSVASGGSGDSDDSESSSIRQLELRAIFGVDRELTESEILQRCRSLPGVRNLSRVGTADVGAMDAIKRMIGGLGFGEGQVKLYCGNSPIEFVREGPVMLAVQTDGSFAPGVRETLFIAARELGRM